MLQIKDLHASVEEKDILKGINLEVQPGEIHAIMGPNGSGKSTFASVIAGKDAKEDERALFEQVKLTGFPTYTIIDKQGEMVYSGFEYRPSSPATTKILSNLIAQ